MHITTAPGSESGKRQWIYKILKLLYVKGNFQYIIGENAARGPRGKETSHVRTLISTVSRDKKGDVVLGEATRMENALPNSIYHLKQPTWN